MLRRTPLVSLLALAAIAAHVDLSTAQTPSGAAEKVAQSTEAAGSAGARVLQVSGPVFMGDEVRTSRSGEAQIRFADNTRFVVGPNARVLIDRFVYSGGSARTATFSAVKGAFRFISGDSPKGAYLIRTPVMTIGVRGTGLDGFVEAGTGRTTIALYEGAAELCDVSNQCIVVEAGCTIVVAPPGGGFEAPSPATRGLFLPYSVSQASLLPQYRLDTSACAGAVPSFTTPGESGGGSGGGPGGGTSGGGTQSGGGGDGEGR